MTQNSNNPTVTVLTWAACVLVVASLAALGIMTKRLDHTIQEFAELGVALPPFTIFLFDLPRYVYVLLIACLAIGLLLNQYSNSSPSTKLAVNLFLATVSILAALLMWRGTSLLFTGGIRGFSESG